MAVQSEQDILELIEEDIWMMEVLKAAHSLGLPDWWVCAGFVRSKIWDTLHGFKERTSLADIDVIYFDPENLTGKEEEHLEKKLGHLVPDLPWSVKNQARMHVVNGLPPYTSSADAISKFPETATALGVKLDEQGGLVLISPCGIEDVLNMEIHPTPHFLGEVRLLSIYRERLEKKNWTAKWGKVKQGNSFLT
ncbi:nucleotidyltransferase family protein [Planomicrobium sp. CPCC 101079]|uniref:nucleotidyltransferase family protein n=1 Tax=Planomicrobium sp. CPCC 101079 TaxID=2599618 RepID=UPI0011B6758E|nr:nucleotidyltransferase family protein [Planomicrobium sp. CPCC 101079]TWT13229.1 nucleotidyltransferase family protein [Planomicrobium sp. CPCC 101079]